MKKISVIIPVYNVEEYINDCLQSIEKQTIDKNKVEIIIINDGSKDKSLKIIKKYIYKHPDWKLIDRENRGLSLSRNEGLDIMTGDYVTFFDSDDILEKDALLLMYNEVVRENKEIGIFKTRAFNSTSLIDDRYNDKFKKLNTVNTLNNNLVLATFIRSVAIIYSKKIIKDIRFIPNTVHEDNYFCIKAYSKAKEIYVSNSYVYKIRVREGNNPSIMQRMGINSYKDMLLNVTKADLEIKNKKLIKVHANQLISYINNNLKCTNYYEAYLLLKDYLYQMYKNSIINFFNYLYLRIYFNLKSLKKINKYLLKQKIKLAYLSILTLISPKLNIRIFYRKRMKKELDLQNPKDINDKIQWLKLYKLYPNELVTKCTDKVEVRNYIREKGCEEILTNVIRVYDSVDEIDFSELPDKYALKWNFGCSYNIICTDNKKLNNRVTKKLLKKWGKSRFHLYNAELQYKNIKKRLICEEFIESEKKVPDDYKFYCYNGKAEYVMICIGMEMGKPKFYFFDRNWESCPFYKNSKVIRSKEDYNIWITEDNYKIIKPINLNLMFEYADKLSEDFNFVRVDLYNSYNKIYFGELTFTPSAGLDSDCTETGLIELGKKIKTKEKSDKYE